MPASPALYRAACQQGQSRARVGRKNSSACQQPPSTFAQEDSRAGWRERNRVTSPPPTCFRSDAERHLSRSAFVDQDFHRGPHRADCQSPAAGLRTLRSMRTRSAIHPLTATVRWSFMAKWMSRSLGGHARPRRTARTENCTYFTNVGFRCFEGSPCSVVTCPPSMVCRGDLVEPGAVYCQRPAPPGP